ncbi:MAG: HEAT repeat domain-containing protein [Nitrospirales bacterium]
MVCAFAGCYASTTPEPEIVIPHLIALLQDPHPALRQTAALSLGKIASAEAVSGLLLALRDADPLVRQYSAWALGNLGEHATSKATSALLPLLEDPVPAVAEAAAQAIGSIGAGPEVITRMLTILREGSLQARRSVISALGLLESPLAYEGLLCGLLDGDAHVRQGAIAALGELGERRAVPSITTRLRHDTEAGVRTEAAYRLGTLGDERSLPVLRAAAVEDPSEQVRRWAQRAIEALSSLAGPGSTT